MATRRLPFVRLTAWLAAGLFPLSLSAQKMPSTPKWRPLELTFQSRRAYASPFQAVQMRVLFVSPLGETNRVYGFWDGGKTWRVRYQPSFPGRWTYSTMCSDTGNSGLHEQTGEFLCTAAEAGNRFAEHGPLRVARDQQHFEHADHTPFLWLGDAAGDAAARANTRGWAEYVKVRAGQKFNVTQWKLPASAYRGRAHLEPDLDAFRQLDAKIAAANQAGLLNAIAPLWEIGVRADETLPPDQALALLRYCVARWDAYDVAWILAFEADASGVQAARWQQIGRDAFDRVSHSPVVILPGESIWVLDSFRQERWVDALGLQTIQADNEDSLPWLLNGPLSLEREKTPARPLVTLSPPAETADAAFVTSGLSRHCLWWGLLRNTPAGVSSRALAVADWQTRPKAATADQPWHQATATPGATAMAPLSDCFDSTEFWRLTPLPQALADVPDPQIPRKQNVAVTTENRDLILVYVPEERAVSVAMRVLPPRTVATWFDPRTGNVSPANAIGGTGAYRFDTPGPGDWLLVLKARK